MGYETAALVTLASDGLAAGHATLALTGQEREKHWDEEAECASDRYSYCAHALDCCIEDATPPGSPWAISIKVPRRVHAVQCVPTGGVS